MTAMFSLNYVPNGMFNPCGMMFIMIFTASGRR